MNFGILQGGFKMSLTPEERKRIYEEEKARMETGGQAEKKGSDAANTLQKLNPNLAGLLCYIGGWVSGLIFLLIEEKNPFVRFHAAQSIVVFGTLNLLSMLLGWIPGSGGIFTFVISGFSFIFWVVLMVKAYQGELYRLPVAGEIAESLAKWKRSGDTEPDYSAIQSPQAGADPEARAKKTVERTDRRSGTRAGRITASAFAIAASIVMLVVFNSFYQFIAFYNGSTSDGVTEWTRFPLFTEDIRLWLPVLTLTLILNIIAHVILIIYDKYILRESSSIVLDIFGLATVLSMLSIYPFDFSTIPDSTAADITAVAITLTLVFIAAGISIGILVRSIRLIVRLVSGKAHY